MSGVHDSMGPESVTTFYRERMSSFLRESPLPPTDWELKNHHEHLQQEVLTRYRSSSIDDSTRSTSPSSPSRDIRRTESESQERVLEESLSQAFSEAKKCHKEMRSKMLIDSVLGKKNYVVGHDHP